MRDLKSMTLEELELAVKELGEKKFRAKQIFEWFHKRLASSLDEMNNLPKNLKEKLQEKYEAAELKEVETYVSRIDGTRKYLFQLNDGNMIESVLMKYKHGNSLCISSQVGCRMGCNFCASTLGGLVRNLTPSEMLEEVYAAQRESGEKVASIVLMGIGEPLDNFDNVMQFLEILSSPEGMNLSLRHVSLSTCGLVDGIYKLMEKKLQLTLSISLHAPNDEIRNRTMPVNKKYNVAELMKACRDYFRVTGRRISFEYALIGGVNDRPQAAKELAALLKGMPCHVNLIPLNPVEGRMGERSKRTKVLEFQKILESRHITATIRREMGSDIDAACGQLRGKNI